MNKEEWRMQRTNPSRLQTGLRRLRLGLEKLGA